MLIPGPLIRRRVAISGRNSTINIKTVQEVTVVLHELDHLLLFGHFQLTCHHLQLRNDVILLQLGAVRRRPDSYRGRSNGRHRYHGRGFTATNHGRFQVNHIRHLFPMFRNTPTFL